MRTTEYTESTEGFIYDLQFMIYDLIGKSFNAREKRNPFRFKGGIVGEIYDLRFGRTEFQREGRKDFAEVAKGWGCMIPRKQTYKISASLASASATFALKSKGEAVSQPLPFTTTSSSLEAERIPLPPCRTARS